MWARVCGSRPTVGSSRNSTRGECSRPRAISSRRFIPPENVRTMLARRVHSPTISITASDAVVDVGGRDAVELGVELEVLLGGQVLVEGLVLEDEADASPHSQPVGRPRRTRRRAARPAVGAMQRAQHRDRRRLAGAVGPEEPERLAGCDVERDPAHGLDVVVALDEVGDLDCRGVPVSGDGCDRLGHRAHAVGPSSRTLPSSPESVARSSVDSASKSGLAVKTRGRRCRRASPAPSR